MELYIVKDLNKDVVMAHSRDKELIHTYVKSLNNSKRYNVYLLSTEGLNGKRKKEVKEAILKIEDDFFDKTLSFMSACEDVQTEEELNAFSLAEEEFDKLKFMVGDLNNIITNYNLDKEDKKQLKATLKLLKKLQKPDNFQKATGFDDWKRIVRSPIGEVIKNTFKRNGKW